jgi:UDP-N-acetylmuramoyl-tripeptide--D-alanyl-D-alanine ligase
MLTNKAEFHIHELKAIFGENNLYNFNNKQVFNGVSTDTRTITPGNIFIALKGENTDGHTKINEAFNKGASAVIIEKSRQKANAIPLPSIIVDNTLVALGKLANYRRNKFTLPVIAIGGSNGKTTTKNMTAHLLSQKFNVLSTFENFNNQIGVPLMLFQLDETHDIAVIEIGTNEPGEISILSSILNPTHGLITNIGKEHLEKFIDIVGVELEETFLFGYLVKKGGFAFINFDDERLIKYSVLFENFVSYAINNEAKIKAWIDFDEELHPRLKISNEDSTFFVELQTSGYTTALNAIASTAVAISFGLSSEEIIEGFQTFVPEESHGYARSYVQKISNFTLINDCYNANPDSMAAALNTLKLYPSRRGKIAVLGDMLELGEASFSEHSSILELSLPVADNIFIFGSEMKKALNNIKSNNKITHFENKNELVESLINSLKEGDVILVKGSRGMKMETIIESLKNKFH